MMLTSLTGITGSVSLLFGCLLSALLGIGSSRFILVEEFKTWSDANDYCVTQYGTTLATALNDDEVIAIQALKTSSGQELWIGLNDIDEEGLWVWESGFECESDCDQLDWWCSSEPNQSGNEDCAEVWASSACLNDIPCTQTQYFVCDDSSIYGPSADPTTAYPTAVPTGLPTMNAPSFDVAAGLYHTCALYEGSIKCWGQNNYGQLGYGHTSTIKSPSASNVDLGDSFDPIKLYGGWYHSCAVSSVGESKCWGKNDNGQLGLGNTARRGDGGNEMGNYLPVVDWGTDFKVESMCTGQHHTCAVSTNGIAKCVGYNANGRLGYGHTTQLGDSSSEMGDALPALDLGDDFEAVQIECGGDFTCALSSDGDLKCWGYGGNGQLGQGDTQNRGDNSGEMGNSLPAINLGTDFKVSTVTVGYYHTCAVSTNAELKCWGENGNGQLGLGDTTDRGNTAGTIDDNLPVVELGDDFIVEDVAAGFYFTCASSTNGTMKCWGHNGYGQLGLGHRTYYGDGANEMGDNLADVLLGTGFTASGLRLPAKYGQHFAFAFEESASGLFLKEWGYNGYGQLGYGDTTQRDSTGEMGEYLPFVDLGFTMTPTADPSAAPTVQPTASPTADPTMDPTSHPTIEPTAEPTRCFEADMHAVDWHDLYHGGDSDEGDSLLQSYSVDFDDSTSSLTLSATVEYVGISTDGHLDDDFNLGTTYWIDLQSFSESAGGIDDAGSCGNRRGDDYSDLDFAEWWQYTVDPLDLSGALSAERTAYPASDWTISSADCNTVKYERTFSLAELTACTDGDGEALVKLEETDSMISVSGSFVVELVSPYSAYSSAYYRTYPLVQHEFELQLSRSVDALASTGVQLFVSSVMSFGHDDQGNYEMRVLMQSADFIALSEGSVVTGPVTVSAVEEETNGCLVDDSFTCAQVFAVTIPSDIDCSVSGNDDVIDFGGTFQIAFSPQCRDVDDEDTAACTLFMDELDESGNVVLDVAWNFVDETCGVDLFEAMFGADLTFYSDDHFNDTIDDEEAYVIDQDTIYGQVEVDLSAEDASGASFYDVVDVSIENVFVCTTDVGTDLSATLSATDGSGGCLSAAVDDNGYYTVIGSGADDEYEGSTRYDVPSANMARFSFLAAHLAFDTSRTTISVHVQLLLTLQNGNGRRRQRMLLEDDGSNQIRHFVGTATVEQQDEEGFAAAEVVVGTTIGVTAIVAMAVFVVMLWMKRRKRKDSANGKCAQSAAGTAVHVPDLSPSEVVPSSTSGTVIR